MRKLLRITFGLAVLVFCVGFVFFWRAEAKYGRG